MSLQRILVAWSFSIAVAGCGGGTPEIVPTEFTAEQAEVFEDGVDFVEDPEALEGRWREDWSTALDKRVSFSDLVAVVRVAYVRTDTDPSRVTTYRLAVEVERALLGEAPADEVDLTVREGATGFGTLEGNDRRLLDERFVLFGKWYTNEAGELALHWHLSPSTGPIVTRVEFLLERRRQVPREGRGTTHVHTN